VSTAVTDGIEVSVQSEFRPERSAPGQARFLYTYTVLIRNGGTSGARLLSRHWIITDARGEREEVTGEGVVGQQPHLEPGQSFQYSSFCVLRTPLGQMRGTYTMARDDGETFPVEIAPFALAVPAALN
jgi:ApaG protein